MDNSWQPIGRTSNQVILYHRPSNVFSVQAYTEDPVSIHSLEEQTSRVPSSSNLPVLARPRPTQNGEGNVVLGRRSSTVVTRRQTRESSSDVPPSGLCPYCYRPMSNDDHAPTFAEEAYDDTHPASPHHPRSSAQVFPISNENTDDSLIHPLQQWDSTAQDSNLLRVGPYFQILEQSVDGSRSSTPVQGNDTPDRGDVRFDRDRDSRTPNVEPQRSIEGYYNRFFIEEKRLGMGAEGSVFLCQHVLDGNYLGHYAIKKVAIGNSKPYLYKILQEVRLLEQLRHPNIIPYHHVWIEDAQFSSFAPPIATLHVLMSYANAGNLDDFIKSRCSTAGEDLSIHPLDADEEIPPEELKRRVRERRKSARSASEAGAARASLGGERKRSDGRAVILLGAEEIASLFGDVVNGLHFLHSNGILHLDLKCSNVLLHSRDGDLLPRAMISDFGTSEEMLHRKRDRTGHTGTMEYMAPETIAPDTTGHWREWDTKADIWSLGLILHKLIFFRLPYGETESYEELSARIHEYPGFKATRDVKTACQKRGIPLGLLTLLEELTHVQPSKRPSIQKVVQKSTTIYSQAEAQVSSVSDSGALISRTQLMRAFRNPWRTYKDDDDGGGGVDDVLDSTIEDWSADDAGSQGVAGELGMSLARIPLSRYAMSGFALIKLCTLLPPFRETIPPPGMLYALILLCVVDLQTRNVGVSAVLNAGYAAGVWWISRR